ncbi:hypothetical protein Daud_0767 [Candidatus Desulforudis audaxviator MP104C]|uniref:Addiction module component, TIGR02574 family n=1 Tax=Desulforudis audaxviator (strain MP104C) TaxID=477974 RepID=B1I2V5_DESAP|nr:hypothetical protein [Candidatus Desulforudis audaxviator]ACA59289.1 hypothetical protein Daud_0767 [Candidatus Desulforudis audaxviator MP104C]
MSIKKNCLKALVDRLSDRQVDELWEIVTSMVWPEEEITPEEARELDEAIKELDAGKRIRAEDVWRELGI